MALFFFQLREWFVETGTKVNEFDRLCEVMSDKANVEITSPIDGIIHELHWKVGEMAQVGLPLMTFKVEVDPNETGFCWLFFFHCLSFAKTKPCRICVHS
jgi:pyruvate/2-oxoglutarate dehydrogenase complex dihydrolipoamide acyltransferase (E2) component